MSDLRKDERKALSLALCAIGITIYIAGLAIAYSIDWKIALSIFMCIAGRGLSERGVRISKGYE